MMQTQECKQSRARRVRKGSASGGKQLSPAACQRRNRWGANEAPAVVRTTYMNNHLYPYPLVYTRWCIPVGLPVDVAVGVTVGVPVGVSVGDVLAAAGQQRNEYGKIELPFVLITYSFIISGRWFS